MSTWLLKWRELAAVPFGTVLVFPDTWDIYPYCIVPAATRCVMVEHKDDIILMLPDDARVREALREWHGCIQFAYINDGYTGGDESPVALAEETPALLEAMEDRDA